MNAIHIVIMILLVGQIDSMDYTFLRMRNQYLRFYIYNKKSQIKKRLLTVSEQIYNKLVSKYYEAHGAYYSLPQEDRDLIEQIINLHFGFFCIHIHTESAMRLCNTDLLKNPRKYDIFILEENIDHLNSKIVLRTQTLTAAFCVKHILVESIEGGSEDSYIFDMDYILRLQPHITEKEFMDAQKNHNCKNHNSESQMSTFPTIPTNLQ